MSHASASFKPCLMDEPAIIGRGHEQRKKTTKTNNQTKKEKTFSNQCFCTQLSKIASSIKPSMVNHSWKEAWRWIKTDVVAGSSLEP